jgi:hypothetical protein
MFNGNLETLEICIKAVSGQPGHDPAYEGLPMARHATESDRKLMIACFGKVNLWAIDKPHHCMPGTNAADSVPI